MLLASLWWLERNGHPQPSQNRLADHAGTDAMMTSQVIRRLEERGLLERGVDPADGRARQLRLTPPGTALLAGALADVERTDESCFGALGDRRGAFVADLATLDARTVGGE